jgi:uncharacterized protein YegL
MAGSDLLERRSLTVSNFGYSAKGIDDLEASEYTLVTLAVDESPSVQTFKREQEECLKEIMGACAKSPRADNLLVRFLAFNSRLREVHGFKPLADCHANEYEDCLETGGMTALYDASVNAVEALGDYGKDLVASDYDVNGIVIVLTDGVNNNSTNTLNTVKDALKKVMKDEALESLISILVGVNIGEPAIERKLDEFHKEAGFTQFVKLGDASTKTLAKLAKFVSQSISSQSQALGTGQASQPLTF